MTPRLARKRKGKPMFEFAHTSMNLRKVRAKVLAEREKREADAVAARIAWSADACRRNWLTRLFCGLPRQPFTREQALASLSEGYLGHSFISMNRYHGSTALDLCDAIEAAAAHGLPLKLTARECAVLGHWLA